jgi:hypothetical protein
LSHATKKIVAYDKCNCIRQVVTTHFSSNVLTMVCLVDSKVLYMEYVCMYSCSPHYVVEQTKAPLSPSPTLLIFHFLVINWTGFPPYCLTCWILVWMNQIYIFSLLTWDDALVGFFLEKRVKIIGTLLKLEIGLTGFTLVKKNWVIFIN